MKTRIVAGVLFLFVVVIFAGCRAPRIAGPTDTQKKLDWWPTRAVPQPVDDSRPNYRGQWWWPTNPGEETTPLWGNRGYVYVLKWTKTEEKVPKELEPIDKELKMVEALVLNEKVHFGFDKSTLTPTAENILKGAAEKLKKYPNAHVTVEGHTCSIGTEEYNMGLGKRRAESVRTFLISQGIEPERLKAMSYGETRRLAAERNASDYALNRRVEFAVEMKGE